MRLKYSIRIAYTHILYTHGGGGGAVVQARIKSSGRTDGRTAAATTVSCVCRVYATRCCALVLLRDAQRMDLELICFESMRGVRQRTVSSSSSSCVATAFLIVTRTNHDPSNIRGRSFRFFITPAASCKFGHFKCIPYALERSVTWWKRLRL